MKQVIRKISFLVFIFCLTTNIFAQNYKATAHIMLKTKKHHMECHTYVNVTIMTDKDKSYVQRYTLPGEVDDGIEVYATLSYPLIEGNVTNITVYGEHRDNPAGPRGCRKRDSNTKYYSYSSSSICNNRYCGGGFMGEYDNGSYVNIVVEPIDVNLAYFDPNVDIQGSTHYLYDSYPIQIQASKDYPSQLYNLEYRVVDPNGPIPPFQALQFYHQNGLYNIKGSDILGSNFTSAAYTKRVDIRLKAECAYSNILSFDLLLSCPEIVANASTVAAGGCDGTDPTISLKLNRNVLPDEKITVRYIETLHYTPGGNNSFYDISDDDIAVVGDKLEFQTYLEPNKSYVFEIKGKYKAPGNADYGGEFQHRNGRYTETIIAPAMEPLSISSSESTPPSCMNGDNGSIKIKGLGGSGMIKAICINQDDNSSYESAFMAQTQEMLVTGLKAGTYTLSLEDTKGCQTEISQEIDIEIDAPDPAELLRISEYIAYAPSILGASDGTVVFTIEKGQVPYSISIHADESNPNALQTLVNIMPESPGAPANKLVVDLATETYYALATDANGCKHGMLFDIPNSPPISIDMNLDSPIECFGESTGQISATASLGTAPYQYDWYRISPYGQSLIYSLGPVLTGIPAGRYRVKVTDANNFEKWSHIIEQTQNPRISLNFSATDVSCIGYSDGSLTVNPSLGLEPYFFLWDNAATTTFIDNMPSGTYSVTVTDSRACQVSAAGSIGQPQGMSMNANIVLPNCDDINDGNISLSVSGGSGNYSYLWNEGSTSASLSGLDGGTYSVTVSDQNACGTLARTFDLTRPETLVLLDGPSQPISEFGLSDGVLAMYIKGGRLPYSITFKNNLNQTFAHDPLVLQGDGSYLIKIRNLGEGLYSLDVKGANYMPSGSSHECSMARQEFNIAQPPLLKTILKQTALILCNGSSDGELSAEIFGGIPFDEDIPFLFEWYKDEVYIANEDTALIGGLSPGTYKLKVTDKNNISAWSTPIVITQPEPLLTSTQASALLCYADSNAWASLHTSGGTAPYYYEWEDGQSTAAIQNLPAGKFAFVVTDQHACLFSDTIHITQPDALAVESKIKMPPCFDDSNGSIELIATGGTLPYNYFWSNGGRDSIIENLSTGLFSMNVVDSNGCEWSSSIAFPERTPVKIKMLEIIQPRAFQGSDGYISALVHGGEKPYTAKWKNDANASLTGLLANNSDTSNIASLRDLPKGRYFLRMEDANTPPNLGPNQISGCVDTLSFYIDEPPLLEVYIEQTAEVVCFGQWNASIQAHAQGGVPQLSGNPYEYLWFKNGSFISAGTNVLEDIGAGSYSIAITDANGIVATSDEFVVLQPDDMLLEMKAADILCSSDLNGWVETSVAGGNAPYRYDWSTGDETSRVEDLPRGKYFVVVTDSKGCETLGNVAIIQAGGIKAKAVLSPPTCYNGTDGQISLQLSGGTPPYNYSWENKDKDLKRKNLRAGSYTFFVEDANKCSQEVLEYEISQPDSIMVDLGPDKILCTGQTYSANALVDEACSSYKWYDASAKLVANTQTTPLSEAGKYRVDVITNKGCKGSGSFQIIAEHQLIASDFVVASKVPINDDVMLVNISHPKPDRVEWILPQSDEYTLISQEDSYLSLYFTALGTYTLGLKSFVGNCEQISYKSISVMEKKDIENYEENNGPLLKSYSVSPVPTSGLVYVKMEFSKKMDAQLLLINNGSGKVIAKYSLKGADKYKETIKITSPPGTYTLRLITPELQKSTKIIKQ